MNERLKELAVQAGVSFHHALGATYTYGKLSEILEKFAELVREDERTFIGHTIDVTDIVLRAKAEEREACAALCESMGVHPALNIWGGGPEWYQRQKECATAIRARGNHEST